MKILLLGDIVGSPGRRIVKREIPILKKTGIGAVVANAENAAAGSGITAALARELFSSGVDAVTLGDHTWSQKEFAGEIDAVENLVRPANFPPQCPGKGWRIVTLPTFRFALVNLVGRTFMQCGADCPFRTADAILSEMPKDIPVFVDFHAEATSEKIAFASYVDGRVACVWGTHTHVQTSDARILPKGTAFITDLGMCGPYVSSIGRSLDAVTKKFVTGMPARFDVAGGPATMEGAVVEIDTATGRAVSIESFRVREPYGG